MVGGGQLARMMAPAAAALGIDLRVLVEAPDGAAARVVVDAPVGLPPDAAAVLDLVAGPPPAHVLTFEHEQVPDAVLARVGATGVPLRPAPTALRYAQDKLAMRRRLSELGVPCPRWAPVTGAADLDAFLAGRRGVVKTARGGYDGRGVRVVSAAEEVADWLAGPTALLVEELVPFTRELAVLLARSPSGETRAWPVVQTVQRGGVCAEVLAPAPELDPAVARAAEAAALAVAEGLEVTGVLAVEMFEVAGGVVVNELAMRPHNSGHWTIDGAVTGQFEQHLRAVLDLPLGDTAARAPWSVMVNVLGSSHGRLTDALAEVLRADDGVKVHLYGKEIRPGRKLGHVTVCGHDLADVRARARAAAGLLEGRTGGQDGARPGAPDDGEVTR